MGEDYLCDVCGGRLVLTVDGKLVCPKCGTVKEYVMVGQPYMYYDKSGRDRQYVYTDIRGEVFGVGSKARGGWRMRRLDASIKMKTWSLDPRVLEAMEGVASRLSLPYTVVRSAIQLYRRAARERNPRELNNYVLAAASLVVASWLSEVAKTPTIAEVAQMFREAGHLVTKRKLARAVSLVRRFAGSEISYMVLLKKYIVRLSSALFDDRRVRLKLHKQRRFRRLRLDVNRYKMMLINEALAIAQKMPLRYRLGRSPYILAASLTYIGEKKVAERLGIDPVVSQKTLSDVAGVSEYSIRDNIELLKGLL